MNINSYGHQSKVSLRTSVVSAVCGLFSWHFLCLSDNLFYLSLNRNCFNQRLSCIVQSYLSKQLVQWNFLRFDLVSCFKLLTEKPRVRTHFSEREAILWSVLEHKCDKIFELFTYAHIPAISFHEVEMLLPK